MDHNKLAIEKEERMIRKLDKKLGINRKKRKEKRSFDMLGLGDIFDIIESSEKYVNQLQNESKKTKKASKLTSSQNEVRGDIYGRLIDCDGTVIENTKIERKFDSKLEELDTQLLKMIRGLLNRLTSSNLSVISSQIEDLLKQFSLNQLCSCVAKCIQDLIIRDNCLSSQKLISEMAMLITVLHCNIGEEVGGHFIHYFISQFDQLFNLIKENKIDTDSKKLDNILILISHFYSCCLIESGLIFEIISKLVDHFSDKCIEMIHLMLQLIGFRLRKDDSVEMKNLIIHVNSVAAKCESKDSRIKFMLETLTAIKNNNIYKLASFNQDLPINCIDVQNLLSTLKNGIKTKSKPSSIPGHYDEILKSNRWWIKSGTLIESESDNLKMLTSDTQEGQNHDSDTKTDRLCTKLRLVTPLRRSLFKTLINSQDYIDCSQKLIEIGKRQFNEIINVCLVIALKEKEFNLFYVYLLKQLASTDRKFKLSLNFAIRDKIVNLKSIKPNERANLSTLIHHLLQLDVIPITVLKVIEFSDLDGVYVQFLRQTVQAVLNEEEKVITKILSKIKAKDSFATALRLFIACFLDSDYKQKFSLFQ